MDLLRRYHRGATVEQLSEQTGVSCHRIKTRLRAAAFCFLSLGTDRNFPVRLETLEQFEIDWDLLWFD